MILDQRDVHGELAVSIDEFLGAIKRIYQPVFRPLSAFLEAG
jgi:hypothetical protein